MDTQAGKFMPVNLFNKNLKANQGQLKRLKQRKSREGKLDNILSKCEEVVSRKNEDYEDMYSQYQTWTGTLNRYDDIISKQKKENVEKKTRRRNVKKKTHQPQVTQQLKEMEEPIRSRCRRYIAEENRDLELETEKVKLILPKEMLITFAKRESEVQEFKKKELGVHSCGRAHDFRLQSD
mmetsp:Transcript_44273/g.50990  ORF Transcript_44273/g.50990 Transcript_44273/m.50990 type:complete len:180 (-) Transcript_44273:1691-2230(-)